MIEVRKILLLTFSLLFYFSCGINHENTSGEEKLQTDYFDIEKATSNPDIVISLNLEGQSLTEFPDVFSMKRLKYLSLGNNYLTKIPDNIGLLKSLRYLDMTDNKLTYLPESMGELDSIETLFLMFNPIDSIMPGLCNTKNLKELNLSGAGEVKVPDCLRKYDGLRIISDAPH